MRPMLDAEIDALAAMVDAHGLTEVLYRLYFVCRANANRLAAGWTDPLASREWETAARKIAGAMSNLPS